MEETVIWVGGLAIEALLVTAIVLALLLRRSRKAQQQLSARLAGLQGPADHAPPTLPTESAQAIGQTAAQTSEPPRADIDTSPAEPAPIDVSDAAILEAQAAERAMLGTSAADEPLAADHAFEPSPPEVPGADEVAQAGVSDPDLPQPSELALQSEFDQLLLTVDSARLDESVQRLQQRLDETTESLQRLASLGDGETSPEVATLQHNLKGMTEDVVSLQQSNTQLQHDLKRKTEAMEHAAAKARDNTEIVLQHARKLRGDIASLREKLQSSDADVQRLQAEKESLAAEYEALNKEYEQIYSHGRR
jgi:DNA repair exonuclease SbcCD ATPase subunit